MGIEMKKLIIAVLLLGTAYSGFAAAENEISANATLASDYRFRGISQTNRDPAIQGGFDFAHESGAYLGTWASNVSFTDGGTEIDVYGGWAGDLSEAVSLDVGFLYYGYPSDKFTSSDAKADYVEIYGSVGFAGATVGLNYSPKYTYDTGDFWYLYGEYSLPVGETFSVDLHVGLNQFKGDNLASFLGVDTGVSSPGKSYVDYSVSGTASVAGVDLTLAWIGTDINKHDCFPSYDEETGDPSGTKDCRGNVVFSVSKSF
jgi:uncharacterized protein (TIGR02001 family)